MKAAPTIQEATTAATGIVMHAAGVAGMLAAMDEATLLASPHVLEQLARLATQMSVDGRVLADFMTHLRQRGEALSAERN